MCVVAVCMCVPVCAREREREREREYYFPGSGENNKDSGISKIAERVSIVSVEKINLQSLM